ncbi:MAG: hypothetical protein JWQ92_1313 [Amnibacterium sp.]|nr:hypothetical protein [Amnibacterium sp.]
MWRKRSQRVCSSRVRKGHFADPGVPVDVVRAARVGGIATATTAGRALGLWTPRDQRLHVALPLTAARLRDADDADRPLDPADVVLHWGKRVPPPAQVPTRIAPLLLVLEHALLSLRPELAIAMIDSVLHLRHARLSDLTVLRTVLPAHLGVVVARAEPRCESGLESVACYLLRAAGYRVEVQVVIPGVGRVDLLVEGRLIVELDGRTWHDDPMAFARDRRRDAASAASRYRTLRFDSGQVLHGWPTVLAAVAAALA